MEQWKAIVGWEGAYEVSDHGRVRSLPRVACDGRRFKGRMLKLHGKKYSMVALSNGEVIDVYVHHLVLAAFVAPRPDGLIACHGDDDGKNNRLGNLRWDTYAANAADAKRHGLLNPARGVHNQLAKLTLKDVAAIRADKTTTARAMGRRFGVSHSRITAVRRGESYA